MVDTFSDFSISAAVIDYFTGWSVGTRTPMRRVKVSGPAIRRHSNHKLSTATVDSVFFVRLQHTNQLTCIAVDSAEFAILTRLLAVGMERIRLELISEGPFLHLNW